MFNIDEDDILTGSPKSKFFDMVFYANKNVVAKELENKIDRYVAMEYLLNEILKENLEIKIREIILEKYEYMENGKNDFFIDSVGRILSEHE